MLVDVLDSWSGELIPGVNTASRFTVSVAVGSVPERSVSGIEQVTDPSAVTGNPEQDVRSPEPGMENVTVPSGTLLSAGTTVAV